MVGRHELRVRGLGVVLKRAEEAAEIGVARQDESVALLPGHRKTNGIVEGDDFPEAAAEVDAVVGVVDLAELCPERAAVAALAVFPLPAPCAGQVGGRTGPGRERRQGNCRQQHRKRAAKDFPSKDGVHGS
jgi:hypothetical protein